MKRRGFFGALAGMVAAPVAVKAAEAVEALPVAPDPIGIKTWKRYSAVSDCSISVTCGWSPVAFGKTCIKCGKTSPDVFSRCPHCP